MHIQLAEGFGEVGEGFARCGLNCYTPVFSWEDAGDVLELGEEETFHCTGYVPIALVP